MAIDFKRKKKKKVVGSSDEKKKTVRSAEVAPPLKKKKAVAAAPTKEKRSKKGGLLARLQEEAVKTQKQKEDRESRSYSKIDWFKPEKGKNTVRILPHWSEPEDKFFFVKKSVHYIPTAKNDGSGIFNSPVLCQQEHFNKPCLICKAVEKANSLAKKAKKKDQETLKTIAGDLRPTTRYLYNIINYNGDDPEVQVWAAPMTVHEDIMNYVEDLDCDFWDLEEGRDWRLRKTVDPKRGRYGVKYAVQPAMNDSAVPEKIRESIEELENLDNVWAEAGVEEMKESIKLIRWPKLSKTEEDLPAKKSAKFADDDEEYEEDEVDEADADEEEDEEVEEEDDEEDTEEEDDEDEDDAEEEDEDDDISVDAEDDDLEAELAELGVQ